MYKKILALGAILFAGFFGFSPPSTEVEAQSSWTIEYTPLVYPHPLQAEYDEDLCEDDINVTVDNLGVTPSHARDDVQDAINAADDDDCVFIPALDGAETWATSVTITNKRIQLIGPGETNLNLTCTGVCVAVSNTGANAKTFRLTAMTWTCDGTDCMTMCGTSTALIEGFRIDHMRWVPSGGVTHGIQNNCNSAGLYYGLLDHINCDSEDGNTSNYFDECGIFDPWVNGPDQGGGSCPANNDCIGDSSWAIRAPLLGSDDAIVWEDSTFSWDSTDGGCCRATQDTDLGAVRYVFRYNTVERGTFQSHGARSNHRGMAFYEVYRNSFTGSSAASRVNLLHDGVAHWFENTIDTVGWGTTGANLTITSYRANTAAAPTGCLSSGSPLLVCDGSHSWDGNLDASTGWPCLDQIGRLGSANKTATAVSGSTWEPYKAWSNGTTSTCQDGGPCNNTSRWVLNGTCANAGATGKVLADYYKPYNAPHSNAAHALGPANMWDYMDQSTGGMTVYTQVSDLPSSCTQYERAWVTNAGTWNQSANGHPSGVLYECTAAAGGSNDRRPPFLIRR